MNISLGQRSRNAQFRAKFNSTDQKRNIKLINVRIPRALCICPTATPDTDAFVRVDVSIANGRIDDITPHSDRFELGNDEIDAGGRIVFPAFVDCHTHLDKGHILPRTPEADGTFESALKATGADRASNWTAKDVAQRMQFSLKSAYHYGTRFIRTHIDSQPEQHAITWPVFEELRAEWAGRIELQAACLFGIDLVRDTGFFDTICRRVAEANGVLGTVAYPVSDLEFLLDRLFQAAQKFGLDLDFHADETSDPTSDVLMHIAEAAIRHGAESQVLVGHCCSLAMQHPSVAAHTLDRVAEAGLAIVSLPMCNLYLQDRRTDGTTPRWRGITLLHEIRQRGIPLALGSDNVRDPFHAYGDLDMLETFRMATRIGQLDNDIDDWPEAVTRLPAAIIGNSESGILKPGVAADLVVFKGRNWTELLSRPEPDRIVINNGQLVDAPLPDYAELDDLMSLT